jgi:alcohol dehydrogenase
MKAAVYMRFGGDIEILDVAEPVAPADGVVVEVLAVGLCRSDFHGWHGTDPDIVCPHVGGHEFVGRVVQVGGDVHRVRVGDRVVAPFVCGCGSCEPCRLGQHQVCRRQEQPGFTRWGAFAQYTVVPFADVNAVVVPGTISDIAAALVGCRVSTAYRGVVERGRIVPGEVMVVHACGGVGLAAVAIGAALGAHVVAVDISSEALALATAMGAQEVLDSTKVNDVGDAIQERFGGAHLSVECLGHVVTATNSIRSLRPLGRHVQIGLFPTASVDFPVARVIRDELEVHGVHGLSASRLPQVLEMVADGRLDLARMVSQTLCLRDVVDALPAMGRFAAPGVAVVTDLA